MSEPREFKKEDFTLTLVDVDSVNVEASRMAREANDTQAIDDYVKAYVSDPRSVPYVFLFDCGGELLIGDGRHRVIAMQRIEGMDRVQAYVVKGTPDECYGFAIGRNLKHGVRLTLVERKAHADDALRLWPSWSDRRIGEYTGVHHETVANQRYFLQHNGVPMPVRREGKDRKMRDIVSTGDFASSRKKTVSARKAVNAPNLAAPLPPPPGAVELDRDQMSAHLATAERWIKKVYAETGNQGLIAAIQEVQLVRGACQLELPGMPVPSNPMRRGTLKDVRALCIEIGLTSSDGDFLFEKWEGNGWKVNDHPIRDWRMTAKAWKRVGNIFPSQKQAMQRNNGKPPEASLQQKIMNEKIQRAEKTLSKLGL